MDSSSRPHFDRSDLMPHWKDSLCGQEREAKLAAWQAHQACADCAHWEEPDPEDWTGVCGLFRLGALFVPADHSCEQWQKHKEAD